MYTHLTDRPAEHKPWLNTRRGMFLRLDSTQALASSALLAAGFVGSLYVWRSSLELPRDDPRVIVRRFISIACWCAIAPLIVAFWAVDDSVLHSDGRSALVWLGLPSHGLLPALFLPLLLTASLFAGPLFVNWLAAWRDPEGGNARYCLGFSLSPGDSPEQRLITVRNVLVGPLCEEWCFRSCMCPLLIAGGWSTSATVFGSPLLFGCAHLHHLVEHCKKQGMSLKQGAARVIFQLAYTTLFGAYAAFVLVRTGHFVSAFLAHAFCNLMGFPDLSWLSPHHDLAKYKTRTSLVRLWLALVSTRAYSVFLLIIRVVF